MKSTTPSPVTPAETDAVNARQGIQSVEVAGPLLLALAKAPGPLALSALAKGAGMPAAKAHRYLVSLIRIGLVEQDAASGLYDLGTLALELGLVSLGRLDAVRLADRTLEALRDATSETVALSAWGTFGPTYIRLLQSRRPVAINLQIGSVMPMTYTASGLCFAAFMPKDETKELLRAELMQNRRQQLDAPQSEQEFAPLLQETRQHGMARMIGHLDPAAARAPGRTRAAERLIAGFNAFSAPVFDHEGRMRFALTVVGSAAQIDHAWEGPVAQQTRVHARQLSQRLGFRE
ncbi:MAG: IclR family transcriptional regulator [Bacillota bacterium]